MPEEEEEKQVERCGVASSNLNRWRRRRTIPVTEDRASSQTTLPRGRSSWDPSSSCSCSTSSLPWIQPREPLRHRGAAKFDEINFSDVNFEIFCGQLIQNSCNLTDTSNVNGRKVSIQMSLLSRGTKRNQVYISQRFSIDKSIKL